KDNNDSSWRNLVVVRLVLAASVILLIGLSIIPVFADTGVMSVVSGKTFQVNYNTSGVKILNMETNPTYDELTVAVQVSSPNSPLELTIPRSLLDSKQGSNDIPFITVVDGTLANVAEKNPTDTTRTISIQLTPGNQQIEIIGTFVAVSGPNGASAPTTLPSSPQQTTPQPTTSPTTPPTTTMPSTNPAPKTVSPTPSAPQTSVAPENVTAQANMTQNISFTIPYVKNMSVTLSYVDLAVIGAICLVIIIVIASAARRRPNKIASKSV
ncbi:MAG: hypothetical protein KGI25_01335, partial [Thaumarchaeota archaeon]|nr:hypothetical protein [Nitrososphaerota archaeon]